MLIFISRSGNTLPIKKELENLFPTARYLRSSSIENMYGHYFSNNEQIEKENLRLLRESLSTLETDVLFVNQLLERKSKSFFAFDMDSTLIKEEIIDELARRNGVYDQVASVTREAMEGNLDFDSALRKRCSFLNGLSESSFQEIFENLTLNDGVSKALPLIQSEKGIIAIFSGGFIPVIERFAKKFSIDILAANTLEMENGFTTGNVLGNIVNKDRKKELLITYRESLKVSKNQTVAVGDGSNDSLMLNEAGIGIGFHAKSGLKKEILNWIDYHSMLSLLFLFDSND